MAPLSFFMRIFSLGAAAILGLVVIGESASAQKASPIAVLFVGCPADGQMGPIAAPTAVRETPAAPASAGSRLTYYASTHLGVLAPRGWHCFGLYGSNGSILIATPDAHDANELMRPETRLSGPVVQLSRTYGGTSGRIWVADVAARLFPAAKPFVQRVMDEGLLPNDKFSFRPYADDRLTRRSETEVEFLTPGNREGIGTSSRIARNAEPISGVAILLPTDNVYDLIYLAIRLPTEMRPLSPTIVKSVETDHETPPLGNPR